ncbi:MAG: 2-oxoacid:acceptor oxidoreductase family protein [Actinomycetota bacterium]
MSGVLYETFERHAHAEGLKAHSTHYCPGCGHGLVHKYLAEAIEELGVQDRTVAISPVGCSVFLYYYLDVGNTQAAHGRAPAVALGHKVANPDAVVVSYQGDGDLASIGLAEIIYAAQMGIPISVIFVNNGIYAMTGGQLAPTTLLGQETSTTPEGRPRFMGEPMKVAELFAALDGPVYVERVALFDNQRRNRARHAIRKALQMQVEKRGFALVEVLSECPVQWHVDPTEAEAWVRERMLPVFPLGVKKDLGDREPWPDVNPPNFEAAALLDQIESHAEAPPRFASGFPAHIAHDDIALKLAGAGGDGAQTAALLLARAAINEGFDSTHIPSYGPESRGGTSYADVHIAEHEVLSPAAPAPHILVAFNGPSLRKFGPAVQAGGTIVYDSTVIGEVPDLAEGVRAYGVPMTAVSGEIGSKMVKNIVALGALQAATSLFPPASFLTAIRGALRSKGDLIALNEAALARGIDAIAAQRTP